MAGEKFSYPLFLNPSLKKLTRGFNALVDHINSGQGSLNAGYTYQASGAYIMPIGAFVGSSYTNTGTIANGTAYYMPFHFPNGAYIDRLAFGNVSSHNDNIKMAIYEVDQYGAPGNIIAQGEQASTFGAGSIGFVGLSSQWINAGLHWIGLTSDAAVTIYKYDYTAAAPAYGGSGAGLPTVAMTGIITHFTSSITYSSGFVNSPTLTAVAAADSPVLAARFT